MSSISTTFNKLTSSHKILGDIIKNFIFKDEVTDDQKLFLALGVVWNVINNDTKYAPNTLQLKIYKPLINTTSDDKDVTYVEPILPFNIQTPIKKGEIVLVLMVGTTYGFWLRQIKDYTLQGYNFNFEDAQNNYEGYDNFIKLYDKSGHIYPKEFLQDPTYIILKESISNITKKVGDLILGGSYNNFIVFSDKLSKGIVQLVAGKKLKDIDLNLDSSYLYLSENEGKGSLAQLKADEIKLGGNLAVSPLIMSSTFLPALKTLVAALQTNTKTLQVQISAIVPSPAETGTAGMKAAVLKYLTEVNLQLDAFSKLINNFPTKITKAL